MKHFKLLVFLLFFMGKGYSQNDCIDAIVVCGNTGFQGLSATGTGIQELTGTNNCSSNENNSIWLRLSINNAGTLGFTLTPESPDINVDFDFFIFGPNVSCNTIGQAVRCSTTNPAAAGSANNQTGLNSTETDTSEGPGANGNNFVQWLTVNNDETYFLVIDRPIGTSNFSLSWTGTATFNEPPVFDMPTGTSIDLEACDTDPIDDGSTVFNLEQNTSTLIGSQTNVAVTYHTNINDALTGENIILNSANFTNTQNPQTMFARITNVNTGCFATTDFEIQVINSVSIPGNRFEICDDTTDGDDANGRYNFDLDQATAFIMQGQDLTGYTIGFYASSSNAAANTAAYPNPYYNTSPGLEQAFMKVTAPDGCYRIKAVDFIVNSLPDQVNVDLVQCDPGLNPDGFTTFNLDEAVDSLTGGDANLAVSFFENGNPIGPNYNNTSNPQQIEALLTDLTTGCSRFNTVDLMVNVINQQPTITPQCDIIDIEDGFRSFDLNTSTLVVSATETVVFYETLQDALLEENPIGNPADYTNPTPYNATVYARIEDANACSGISSIALVVNRLPNIIRQSDGEDYVCANIPIKFLTIDAAILEGAPVDYTYEWFKDGVATGQTSFSIAVNTPGIYTVEVTNAAGCSVVRTIPVQNSSNASITEISIEDLTLHENTITVVLDSSSIGDYLFSLDSPDGPFQQSNVFENVGSGFHTIYINDINGCGLVQETIAIIGAPNFFTPNGDGYNDYWIIDGVSRFFSPQTVTLIFDRYGKLMKQLFGSDNSGWDGTFNGNAMPSDDYWYVINLEDGRVVRGHFSLKR